MRMAALDQSTSFMLSRRADRTTLLERLALRCCQREEQLPVALGETWKAPEQLVFFWRKDLQAIALRDDITI